MWFRLADEWVGCDILVPIPPKPHLLIHMSNVLPLKIEMIGTGKRCSSFSVANPTSKYSKQ